MPHKIKSEFSEKIDKDKGIKMVKFTNSQRDFTLFDKIGHSSIISKEKGNWELIATFRNFLPKLFNKSFSSLGKKKDLV